MIAANKARSYFRRHPGEAMADMLGLAAICAMIAADFSLPAVL